MALLGFAALALAGGGVVLFPVVELDRLCRGPVEVAPAVERCIELLERTLEHGLRPGRGVPRGTLRGELVLEHGQHGQTTLVRLALRTRLGQVVGQIGRQRQLLRLFHVEQVTDAAAELLAGLGQPDRLQVALHQLAVGQVQRRGIDLAVHHAHRIAEVILVVRRLAGAVGDDQSRLPGATGTAAALGVVGRRRRHVAHVDRVERGDVHAQLHGRGAEQHRQPVQFVPVFGPPLFPVLVGVAEPGFAFQPVILLHLGGVFARLEVEQAVRGLAQQGSDVAVQVAEEGVVVRLAFAAAGTNLPEHGTAVELPASQAEVGFLLAHQTVALGRLEQGPHDICMGAVLDLLVVRVAAAPGAASAQVLAQS